MIRSSRHGVSLTFDKRETVSGQFGLGAILLNMLDMREIVDSHLFPRLPSRHVVARPLVRWI